METGLTVVSCALTEAERLALQITHSLTAKPVRIIEVLNPFTLKQRDVVIAPFDNESVGAIIWRSHFTDETGDVANYAVSVNGDRLHGSEVWSTVVRPGSEIVLYPLAGGGSFGKEMMGLLIVLAGAVAGALTAGLALFLFPTLVLTLGASGITALIAGSAAIGSALMSWALAPGPPSAANYSATYNAAGPQGLATPGTPVPKGYGTMGWCGNIVSSYVSFAGPNAYINVLVCYGWGVAVSVTNLLINQKPVSDYFNLSYQTRLGTNTQTAIDGFDHTVNGYPQETDLLVSEGPVVVPGTGTNIEGIETTVKFPGGLYRVTNDGNYVPLKFIYLIQVAPHGTGDWQNPLFPSQSFLTTIATIFLDGYESWPTWNVVPTDQFAGSGLVYAYDSGSHTPGDPWSSTESVDIINVDSSTGSTTHTFTGVWQPVDPNLNPVICTHWWEGYVVVEACTLSALYDTQTIYGLAAGQWDTQVTKIGYCQDNNTDVVYADSTDAQHVCDGWLWNINEVFWSNLTYPNMILVGINALATSQLSGADIQVQATVVHDIGADTVLPAALSSFEHDNPAVVAYDVAMNPVYGAASTNPLLTIDVPAFVAWAEFCDEPVTNQDGTTGRRFVWAGVFDQAGDVWKTLQTIGNMSRASMVPIGNLYSVVLDAPGPPVQLFTVGNTKKDSFQEMWLSLDDRCTLIECDFADGARNWRMDLPVSVMTEQDINSGLQPKVTRTRLIGCTDRDQAWRWTYYQLLSTKLTLRTIQFTAPIESVCCKYGSIIAVQSDVTQWAAGGRVQPGSTLTTLNIERTDLTFEAASGWTVSVQHPVVERGTATISSIYGLNITMTATLPAGRILKLVAADGTEYVVTGYGGSTVTVETLNTVAAAVPMAATQTVTLYDVNVIDVIDVSNLVITEAGSGGFGSAVVTVLSDFSALPTCDSAWAYGQSAGAQPAKLFRVVSIKKSGDFSFDIGALEYNAEAYTDVIPSYGEIVGVPDTAPAITNLTLTEIFQNGAVTGSSSSSVIAVGWQNGNTAVGAQVTVTASTPGVGPTPSAAANNLGNIQGTGCTFVGFVGTTYTVIVTGQDWAGNLLGTPITASITVVAAASAPANVTGFSGVQGATTTVLTWTALGTAPDHYEIRYASNPGASSWVTASVLWDGTGTTWTDTTLRTGVYMIAAVSSLATGSVESVVPATWQPGGIFAPSPNIVTITAQPVPNYGLDGANVASCSAPTGSVIFSGGTVTVIPADGDVQYEDVAPAGAATYYAYLYLTSALAWQGSPVPNINPGYEPDTMLTASDAAVAAASSVDGHYWLVAWAFGSGGTFLSAGVTYV